MVDRDDILVTQEEKDRYYELVNSDGPHYPHIMIDHYEWGKDMARDNLAPASFLQHDGNEYWQLAYRVGYYDGFMDRDAKLAELTKGDFYDQDNHVKSSRLKGSEG